MSYPKMVKRCPFCSKQFEPILAKREDFVQRWLQHEKGQLIQRVWPEATNEEREQLISGVCSQKCWDDNMKCEEEEDDYEASAF